MLAQREEGEAEAMGWYAINGRRLAREWGEPVLLVEGDQPGRDCRSGRRLVLLSQADGWERANASQRYEPEG